MASFKRGGLAAACLVALAAGFAQAGAQTKSAQLPPQPRQAAPLAKPVQTLPGVRPGAAQAETRQPRPGEDLDGDGFVSAAVGGDDCNDADASVYPGNGEIADGKDQDCDPQTIGFKDLDADGYTDGSIFNPGGERGTDCNDREAGIRPDAQELPNGLDDNCDGRIDNLLGVWRMPN